MNSVEILYQQFDEVKIYVNQELLAQNQKCNSLRVVFDQPLPVQIDIAFWPFTIKPIVRYNEFMLDYWLANILQQDHKITLNVSNSFFEDYRNKNIQGRVNSLSKKQQSSEHFFDQYIGVNNGYPTIIQGIKKTLDQ
jgi:hypothetical protein